MNLDKMTAAELRTLARTMQLSTTTRLTRRTELLRALRAWAAR